MQAKVFVLALALALQLSLGRKLRATEQHAAKDGAVAKRAATAVAAAIEVQEEKGLVKRGARNDLDDSDDWKPNFCKPGKKFVEKCNRCWCVNPGIPVCTALDCEKLPETDWPEVGDF